MSRAVPRSKGRVLQAYQQKQKAVRSFRCPLGAKNARANVKGKYGQGDKQSPGPCELFPVLVGALDEVVDGHRQVGHRLGEIETEELVAERSEQQRRGFTGDARRRQQHAGNQTGTRGAIRDTLDDERARQAERGRRFAQRIGDKAEHVLGGSHHDRNDDDSQRQRAGQCREAAHRHHDRAVHKQADDDRGRAQQNVVDETDHRRQPVVLAVFGEIGAGEQPDRRADANAKHRHDDRADDGVEQATIGGTRRRRILGENTKMQTRKAVVEQREQDQRQPGNAEYRGAEAKEPDDDVEAAAGGVNRVHDIT